MKSKKVTMGLFVVYLVFLIWIILFKMQNSLDNLPQLRNINLIPFAGSAIVNGTIDSSEILGNVLAFVPFGVFTGALLAKKSFLKKIAPVFFTSLALEIFQFILAIGASDITDLLTNTLGGITGIGIFLLLSRICKEKVYKVVNIICLAGAGALILFVGVLIIVNL